MISVILPVYNVEKYLPACLKSLLRQSAGDFEIIAVNDGSKDASGALARQLLADCRHPVTVLDTENRGVSAARNLGLRTARGEYAICVDADDVLAPSFLSDFERLVQHSPQSDIYFCDYEIVSNAAGSFCCDEKPLQCLTPAAAQTAFLNRKIRFLLPTMLMKTAWLRENEVYFDEAVRYSEDVQYIWRALAYTKQDVLYLPKKNYRYLFHDNSTMSASGQEKICTSLGGLTRLYAQIEPLLCEPAKSQLPDKWTFGMLHSAAKLLPREAFAALCKQADAQQVMRNITKTGDFKSAAVARVMRASEKLGYALMRKF